MTDRLPYRAMGCLAIVNALLLAVPLIIAPLPPFGPDADLIAFNIAHKDQLLLSNYLAVFQPLTGLVLLVFLSAVTRQAEGASRGWLWMLILSAGIVATGATVSIEALICAEPFVVNLGPGPLTLITQISLYGLDISYSVQALLLAALALAVLRLRLLPAWLGYLAWLGALLALLGTLGLIATSGLFAAAGPVSLLAAVFALPAWLLLVGLYWLVHPAPRTAAAA